MSIDLGCEGLGNTGLAYQSLFLPITLLHQLGTLG